MRMLRIFSLPSWSTVVDSVMDTRLSASVRALKAHRKAPAENASLPKSNRLKMHGIGVTRYSFLIPFGRTTKTTFHATQRLWAPAEAAECNEKRSDGPAYDPQFFVAAPIHIKPSLKETVDLFRGESYQVSLLKKCEIRFADDAPIDKTLLNELDDCGALLKTDNIDSKAARIPLLLGLRRACSDARVANGGEPLTAVEVAKALRYLRQQNLYDNLITPSKPADPQQPPCSDRRVQDLAWRLSYKLATTERGMDLLYRLTNTPMSSAGLGADAIEKDRQRRQHLNLKHFFKAADSLLNEYKITNLHSDTKPLSAEPGDLLEYCYRQCEKEIAPANTLLIEGLTGIQTELCREDPANPPSQWQRRLDQTALWLRINAANQRQIAAMRDFGDFFPTALVNKAAVLAEEGYTKLIALQRRQQAVMRDRFAFKWVSDGHVSNAPGSALYNIDQRCQKIDAYQQRRRDRNERTGAKAFLQRSAEIITAKNKTFFPAQFADPLQHNPDSMLLHREVMQSALGCLEEMMLRDTRSNEGTAQHLDVARYALEPGPQRPLLDAIARLALVKYWLKQPLHYLSNDLEPMQFDIDRISSLDNLHQLFGDHPMLASEGPQRDAFITAFKNALPIKRLTPELLVQWSQQINFDPAEPLNRPAIALSDNAPASKSNEQLCDDFASSINHLLHGWKSSVALTDDPLQNFNNRLAEQIEHMRLGNLTALSGGTSHGVSLPAVTLPLSVIKTLGMAQVLAGATYSHRGMVNLEVGIASWGGFLRITTSNEDQAGANVGLVAGPKAQWGTAVGGAAVYADAEGAGTGSRARGYCFSLPRGGAAMTGRTGSKPGVNGDAEVAAGLAQIWRILTNSEQAGAHRDNPHRPMGILRRIGEEVPDVSVSTVGPGDSHNEEWYVGGRAGAILGVTDESKQDGVGLNASASAIYSRRQMHYRQRSRALEVEVVNSTVRKSLNVQGNVPVAFGLGRDGGNAAVFNNGAQSIAGPQFGFGGANGEVWKSGMGTQTNRIIYEGKISKNTYANIFYPNAKPFCDAIEKNIARWANYKAAHDPNCPALPITMHSARDRARARKVVEIRQSLVDKHTEGLRRYIARVKREVHPSDVYFDFLELTPEATELLNHYYESEIEFRAAGCEAEAKVCKKAFDAVWNHDNTWVPYFVVSSLPQQSNSGARFNLGLSLSSEQPCVSNRFPNYDG